MNNGNPPTAQPKRSELVTVCAWINIAIAALGVLGWGLLLLLFAALFPPEDMLAALRSPDVRGMAPPVLESVVRHARGISAAGLGLSALTVVASIALLRRRNWGRLYTIGLMALIVLASVAGLFYQADMAAWMPPHDRMPPELRELIASMNAAGAAAANYVMCIAQALLFAWGIWRFCQEDIRREFRA